MLSWPVDHVAASGTKPTTRTTCSVHSVTPPITSNLHTLSSRDWSPYKPTKPPNPDQGRDQVQGQGQAKLPPPSRHMHRFTHSCTMCGSGVSCTDKQTGRRHHTFNRDTNFSSLQVTCPSTTVVLSLQLQPHEAPKPVTSWSSLGLQA